MKYIAVICEYNPFHNGHAYQIDTLKKEYTDSGVICIMSGNYTQRAEAAIMQKFERARAAVLCGADLVLELPFPYSCAGAEYFASAGVHVADALGCIDMLSFGSECGDIDKIEKAAKNLLSHKFKESIRLAVEKNRTKSYAAIREETYESMYGSAGILKEPNNILALEYVKALILKKSIIRPITLKREGTGYNTAELSDTRYPSASALRALIKKGDRDSMIKYMPNLAYEVYKNCKCADMQLIERGILASLRLADPNVFEGIAEASGGLGRRIYESAKRASSLDELFSLCATKKYTNARIRRAVINFFVGVREEDIKAVPRFTQLLGANAKGREILKQAKKNFNILVRPAEYKNCDDLTRAQIDLSHRADALYPLMLPEGGCAYECITASPYME